MSPEIEPLGLSRYWLQPQDGLARLASEQGHRTKVPVIFSTEPLRKSLVGLPPNPTPHKHQISTVFPVKQGVQRWKIMFNTGQLKVEQTANQK